MSSAKSKGSKWEIIAVVASCAALFSIVSCPSGLFTTPSAFTGVTASLSSMAAPSGLSGSASIPALSGGGKCKEKVLVTVLAQTRGHRIVWDKFKANFLDNLCPENPQNVDLALCLGQEQNTTNPYYARAKYVWVYPEVHDWGTAFDDIQRQVGCGPKEWRHVLQVKDQWLGGILDPNNQFSGAHKGSAAILIFFRWFLLKNLKENNLLNKYDRFIVTRSDYLYEMQHPPLSVLSNEHIWYPDGEQYWGFTDRHCIVPAKYLNDVINIAEEMVCRPDEMAQQLLSKLDWDRAATKKNWNLEQVIMHHVLSKGLFNQVRFFPYVMFTVRDPNDATRWAAGNYDDETGLIIKYQREFESYKRFGWMWSRATSTGRRT